MYNLAVSDGPGDTHKKSEKHGERMPAKFSDNRQITIDKVPVLTATSH